MNDVGFVDFLNSNETHLTAINDLQLDPDRPTDGTCFVVDHLAPLITSAGRVIKQT